MNVKDTGKLGFAICQNIFFIKCLLPTRSWVYIVISLMIII